MRSRGYLFGRVAAGLALVPIHCPLVWTCGGCVALRCFELEVGVGVGRVREDLSGEAMEWSD